MTGEVQYIKEEVTTESICENLGGYVISWLRLRGHSRQSFHALITNLQVIARERGLNLQADLLIGQRLNHVETSVKVCLSQRHKRLPEIMEFRVPIHFVRQLVLGIKVRAIEHAYENIKCRKVALCVVIHRTIKVLKNCPRGVRSLVAIAQPIQQLFPKHVH